MSAPIPSAAPSAPISSRPAIYAKRLGVSRAFVYELIDRGEIVARKLDGATVIIDADNEGLRERLPQVELHRKAGLTANEAGCARISLWCASMRRKIALNSPGIWGISAKMAPQLVSRVCPGLQASGPGASKTRQMAATLYTGDGHMAKKGRGIFMVYVDIDAQHVQEFNEWYNKEHLPELLSVPGILSAARYEAVKGGPQYLACYELESVAVMQTPAFTSRPRTLWGQKVSPSVIGKNLTRIVGEQIYPDGVEMPERGMAPVLQIGRMSVPAEVDAEWNAWYSGEYVPGYRKVPGVIYARRYRVIEGTSGYSTVYEFASTAVPESPEWKEQQQHSSPNSPRMRQAMTHAPGSAGVYVRVDP
jgi:Domain of unknown function (DUF4286)